MTDPWDIPPFRGNGNRSPTEVYEAVGRALSAWEEFEVSLSQLFGLFSERDPEALETYTDYGKPKIFAERAEKLAQISCTYFIRRPCQKMEGVFEKLLCDGRNFSARRNDIAHGVVRGMPGSPDVMIKVDDPADQPILQIGFQWILVPPPYSVKRLSAGGVPAYTFTAADILYFQGEFIRLQRRALRLFFQIKGDLPPPT
jgi:hypothetical protein